MAKLLIQTQVYENYGDASNPHWKPKCGGDYVIKNFNEKFVGSSLAEQAKVAALAASEQIEQDNEFFRETIMGYKVVADDYLTEFERMQLDYDGKITFPAKEITVTV